MVENERRAADVVTARDLIVRAVTTIGLIGAALGALLAVQST